MTYDVCEIIPPRVNDVKMRGKCDNSLSATVVFTIKEGVEDWFPRFNMVKIVKDSHSAMFLS